MTKKPIVVPSVGESVAEVAIVWLKKPGDTVAHGEPIVVLCGDKADVELEAPLAGVLCEVGVNDTDVVPIGALLGFIEEAPDAPAVPPKVAPEVPREAPAAVARAVVAPAKAAPAPVESRGPRARPEPLVPSRAHPPRNHVVILGAGRAGFAAATRLAQLDQRVTLIDPAPTPGGRAYRGGALARRATLVSSSRHRVARAALEAAGLPSDLIPNMGSLRAHAREVEVTFTRGLNMLLKARRVDLRAGVGCVRAGLKVDVRGPDGTVVETIEGDQVIVATGTVPRVPEGVAIDGRRVVVDGGPLDFEEVPRRLAVIGATTTGLEWAVAFAELGAEVTVLDGLPRLLYRLDEDVARTVARWLARRGVHLHLDARVVGTHHEGDAIVTTFVRGGARETLVTERVLVAAGRRPAGEGIADETLPLERLQGGVAVDADQRTSVAGVWAIGGVARARGRSSRTTMDAVALAERLLGVETPAAHRVVPDVLHLGSVEVASVGMNEELLAGEGVPYRVGKSPFAASPPARASGAHEGLVKLTVHAGSGRVLGAQIVGPSAGELIDEIALAISLGASADDLARLPRAFGTLAETVGEAARAASGWPLMLLR